LSVDAGVDELGSYTEDYSINILSANTSMQLARAPWPSPVNKKMQLLQINVTPTAGTALGSAVVLWDQDLSNSTPPTRGSAGGAILTFGATGSAASGTASITSSLSEIQTVEHQFIAGVAIQATTINVNVAATFKII